MMKPGKRRKRGRPFKTKRLKRRRHPHNDRGTEGLEAEPCRFFKVMLPLILQQNQLRIPDKFVSKLGSGLASVGTLSVPSGLTWNVGISKIDNKLYFTQGWKKFVEHNSIRCGYFLQFEYTGNSNFRVHVFDLTCCEIEYPPNTKYSPKKHHVVQVKQEAMDADHGLFANKGENQNPSCTTRVRKNYFSGSRFLYIPSSTLREYLKENLKKASVKLQASDGRDQLDTRIRCSRSKKIIELVSECGWKDFMKKNNFDVGDAVTFELVGETDNHIALKFFRK